MGGASIMLTTTVVPIVGLILLSAYSEFEGISQVLMWLFIVLLAGSVIWSWIDAVFLNRRVEELNHRQEREIMDRIREIRK